MARFPMPLFVTAIGIFTVALAGAARAATITTPLIGAGASQFVTLTVTNVGNGPATVAVTLTDSIGGSSITADFDDCATGPVAPLATCAVSVSGATGGQFFSVDSSSSKVRVALAVYEAGALVSYTIVPKK
jgi:hypothetical protein